MTEREELIEYAEAHMSDMIPHDDPNYWESLREMAEQYADNIEHGFFPEMEGYDVECEDLPFSYEYTYKEQ
jgi:hypothetical protein